MVQLKNVLVIGVLSSVLLACGGGDDEGSKQDDKNPPAQTVPAPEPLSYSAAGDLNPGNIELVMRDFRETLRGLHDTAGDPESFMFIGEPTSHPLSQIETQKLTAPCGKSGGSVTTKSIYTTNTFDSYGDRVMGAGDRQEATFSNCVVIAQIHGSKVVEVLEGIFDEGSNQPLLEGTKVRIEPTQLVSTIAVLDGVAFDDGAYALSYTKDKTHFTSNGFERRYIYTGNRTAGFVVEAADISFQGAWSTTASGSMRFAGDQVGLLVEAQFDDVSLNTIGSSWYALGEGEVTLTAGGASVVLDLGPDVVTYQISGDNPYSGSFEWVEVRN